MVRHEDISEHGEIELLGGFIYASCKRFAYSIVNKVFPAVVGGKGEIVAVPEGVERLSLIEVVLLLAIHSLVFTSGAQASWKFSCLSSQLRSGRVSRPQQE